MPCKIFPISSIYISLVLVSITYSKASSIYRENRNVNSTNSYEDINRTQSIAKFSLNNEGLQADCKCKNGFCVNDGKRDVCTCPPGWGNYYISLMNYTYECRECECGKGINCTFDVSWFKFETYCLCPDGNTLKNEPCKDFCVKDPCKNGGTCLNVKDGYACNCPSGYKGKHCEILEPCDQLGDNDCRSRGKLCINSPNGKGYECGDCLDIFYKDSEGNCVVATCENIGNAVCNAENRVCKNEEGIGYSCWECLENFRESHGDLPVCIPKKCFNGGDSFCENIGKNCVDKALKSGNQSDPGYSCDTCLEEYIVDSFDEKICVPEKCFNGGDSFCKNIGKNCVDKALKSGNQSEPGYICDTCLEGYLIDPDYENICSVDNCAYWHGYYWCGEKGRNCTSTKNSYSCEGCKNGFKVKNDDPDNCLKENCENFGAQVCGEQGKFCEDTTDGYKCNGCKDGFKVKTDDHESCISDRCENGGKELCMNSGMTCNDNEDGVGYICGRCLDNFRKSYYNKDICVPDTCENFGDDYCGKRSMTCKDKEGGLGYMCDGCFQYFRKENNSLGFCVKETCERFGVTECKVLGKSCKDRESGFGFNCGDCLEHFEEENGKCVPVTCARKGDSECKKINRICVEQFPAGYTCGKCGHGFTEVEGSNICTEDFCLSSPCKNDGICKVENGSFVCFCKHPFCGKTCEVEINPTTSPANISTPLPDLKTTINNSIATTLDKFNWTTYLPPTTKPSNYSRDYNLTTVELHSTPTSITETPNTTLVDFLTTKPSNYSRDYNLTTVELHNSSLSTISVTVSPTTTVSPVNKTTTDATVTTGGDVTTGTVTTSSTKPCTSDRGLKIIFKNDYSIRNRTEVIIKM